MFHTIPLRPRTIATVLAVISVSLVGIATGCGKPRPAVSVLFGLDASDSARGELASGALAAAAVAERLRAGRDGLHLFRMDCETTEFGTGQTIGDGEATLALIGREATSRTKTRGTLPERFWATVEAQAVEPRPVVIVLASDGDNDDLRAESSARIARCIARIARRGQVRGVVLYGVHPRNVARIRAQFAPLGQRLHLFTAGENAPDAAASVIVGCAGG